MERLDRDRPGYEEAIIDKRIEFSRRVTLVWLLLISVLSAVDYFLHALDDDVDRFRLAMTCRVIGNLFAGISFLLCLANADLFRMGANCLTFTLLSCQGLAVLACAMLVYNNEPSIYAIYGIYVSVYSVCSIWQRWGLCITGVIGFVFIELWRCGTGEAQSLIVNVIYLVSFFTVVICSIRLEEFLEHVAHLESRRVKQKLENIDILKASGKELLESLLPPHVITKVRLGVSPIAEHHDNVTIIFTDIKGFTAYSSGLSPAELMAFLNHMYSAFDEVILNWGLHKVEVIGDAYFISSGCPAVNGKSISSEEYAMRAVEVALALLRTMPQVCGDPRVQMRVGLHSGPVVAGVVGKKGPRFHLFGPTVSYAEKMESHGEPSRVQISDDTYDLLLEGNYEYEFEERSLAVEGYEDLQRTWFVNKGNCKAAQTIQRSLMQERRNSRSLNKPGA